MLTSKIELDLIFYCSICSITRIHICKHVGIYIMMKYVDIYLVSYPILMRDTPTHIACDTIVYI